MIICNNTQVNEVIGRFQPQICRFKCRWGSNRNGKQVGTALPFPDTSQNFCRMYALIRMCLVLFDRLIIIYVYVCVCVCFNYIYIHIHRHYISIDTCVSAFRFVYLYLYIYIYKYFNLDMYIYIYIVDKSVESVDAG